MGPQAKQAIVVGAGLAGAAAALALANRGWQVLVLDKAAEPCGAASGVPVGVLSCHVSIEDNPLSQLSRQGLLLTRQFAQSHLTQGQDWMGNGVLERRISPDTTPKKAWAEPTTDSVWHGHVALATPAQLQQASLPADDTQALWQNQGAWIKPLALVQAMLAHDAIEFSGLSQVERMQRHASSGEWQLRVKTHIPIPSMGSSHTFSTESASHVVLALGAQTPEFLNRFLQLEDMGLHPIAGQVSWGSMSDLTAAELPTFAVNGHGSFVSGVPTIDGPAWFTGATFERYAQHVADTPKAHQDNLKRLDELLPVASQALLAASQPLQLRAWTGMRCATVNRLPKVGPLDEKNLPGLYLLTGMGSRGLTLGLLCAEVLAAQMEKSKPPVSESLLKAMRFD